MVGGCWHGGGSPEAGKEFEERERKERSEAKTKKEGFIVGAKRTSLPKGKSRTSSWLNTL